MSEITITTGGKDYVNKASAVITDAFRDDPAFRYVMSAMGEEKRQAYLERLINVLFTAASMNKGIFKEANDWSCVAVWLSPGEVIDHWTTIVPCGFVGVVMHLGLGSIKKMLVDFQMTSNAIKRKAMPGRKKFWYLAFIGTQIEARGQGLATKVIKEMQPRAAADGLPMWLEASTPHSRDVYARCGFEVAEKFVFGKGSYNAEGYKQKGGEGVPLWGMVWWPESAKR